MTSDPRATGFEAELDEPTRRSIFDVRRRVANLKLNDLADVDTPSPAGQSLLTWSDLDQEWQARPPLAALSLVAFAYRFNTSTDNSPPSGDVQFNNADPALVTEVYISETDSTNQNIALFLESLDVGSWCNFGDRGDYQTQHHSYDVTGPPVDNGGSWTIPVTVFENVGPAFTNNQQINTVLRYVTGGSGGDYVLRTGDTMSGQLVMDGGNEAIRLNSSTDRPYLSFYQSGVRAGYVGFPDATSLNFVAEDGRQIQLNADSVRAITNQMIVPDGAAGAPGLAFPRLDTGIRHNTGDMIFESLGEERFRVYTRGARVGGEFLQIPDGTETLPGLQFQSDTDTGIWRSNPNVMSLITGGAIRVNITDDDVRILNNQLRNPDGNAPAPGISFQNDPDTGLFRSGTNQLCFATGGVERGRIISGNLEWYTRIRVPTSYSASAPPLSFNEDPDTGIFSAADNAIGFGTGGQERMRIGNAGLTVNYDGGVGTGLPRITGTLPGNASFPNYSFIGDADTGMYRPSSNRVVLVGGGSPMVAIDPAGYSVLAMPSVVQTGHGDQGWVIRTIDDGVNTGTHASLTFWTRTGTDRHVNVLLDSAAGDMLMLRNFENTAWAPVAATSFTVSSSLTTKERIRTARDEGGSLNRVVAGERPVAYEQIMKVRPVIFDDAEQEHLEVWAGCDDHPTRQECSNATCENADSTVKKEHACDDFECSGTNASPCWLVEQHLDRPGLVAEELLDVWPKAVTRDMHDNAIGIDYAVVTTELVNLVQHLIEENREQSARIEALEAMA